tara:strand:+ start:321 stop:1436 length:1116 start_codon:yes stop_codon:yes gene_type:complete
MKKKKKKKRSKKKYRARKIRPKKKIKKAKRNKNKKKIIKKRKKSKKLKSIKKLKISKIKIVKKINFVKKISFQGVIDFILEPVFTAYENFREKRRSQKLRKIALEKAEKERKIKEERRLRYEAKKQQLKDEQKLARERGIDLKRFLREEQAILRREQAKKRKEFLEELKINKRIEAFRKRELEEITNLEKLALREQREDYKLVEERIEKIKEKYRLIREQKIRERVESLGVEISDSDTRDDLLQKEREYAEHRQKIELILESFYRSANSLVFQLNKKYIPKHKSILRVIDRRYESNECFIRYDDSPDEDWLVLIYLEDSDAKKGKIVVENKANPEKHETKSFDTKEIFTYSDYLVDSMTAHIDRERQKKTN